MSSIVDMIEKPIEPNKVSETSQVNNNGNYQDQVYKSIAFDLEAIDKKSNTFMLYSQNEIPEDIDAFMNTIIPKISVKKKILRMNADNQNLLEEKYSSYLMYKEIYLPWRKFNESISASATLKRPTDLAFRVAVWALINSRKEGNEDKFNALPNAVKSFLARDIHMYLGKDVNKLIDFAIIYTPCGTTQFTKDTDFKALGRASNIIQMAKLFGFKIYNIGDADSRKLLLNYLESEN